MASHLLYALNVPPGGAFRPGDPVSGWLLCDERIERVRTVGDQGELAEVAYGRARPDVTAAFPGFPNGDACGFLVPGGSPTRRIRLDVELPRRLGLRRSRTAVIDAGDFGVQRAIMDGPLDRWRSQRLQRRLEAVVSRERSLTLTVDIINKCNLRCVMCHYSDEEVFRRPRQEMSVDDFRDMFEDLGPLTRKVMLSCADEPLLSKQFPAFLDYLAERHPDVEVSLATNAMLLSDRLRRHIVRTGVVELVASLDGVTAASVERVRTGSDFGRIVGNLLALRDLKAAASTALPLLTLDFIMFRSNVHETPAFVELARRLGARFVDYRHVIPSSYFAGEGELLKDAPEVYDHYRELTVAEAKRRGVLIGMPAAFGARGPRPVDAPVAGLAELDAAVPDAAAPEPLACRRPQGFRPVSIGPSPASLGAQLFCDRPFTEMVITGDMIRPCAFHDAALGHVSEGRSLREVFLGEDFRSFRRQMLDPDGAPGCRACPIKGGYLTSDHATL